MFIGHYAVGFALKKAEPRMPLGLLVLGTALLDILFGVFLLTGVEHMRVRPEVIGFLSFDMYDLPISHSLLGASLWSCMGFIAYRLWPGGDRAARKRFAPIFAAAIFSHYILDLIVHTPDLPLATNSSLKIGFSLWKNVPASILVEIGLLALGMGLYVRATRSTSRWGDYGVTYLALFQTVYFIGCYFGFLPRSPDALATRLIVEQLALVAVVQWVDNNRSSLKIDLRN